MSVNAYKLRKFNDVTFLEQNRNFDNQPDSDPFHLYRNEHLRREPSIVIHQRNGEETVFALSEDSIASYPFLKVTGDASLIFEYNFDDTWNLTPAEKGSIMECCEKLDTDGSKGLSCTLKKSVEKKRYG